MLRRSEMGSRRGFLKTLFFGSAAATAVTTTSSTASAVPVPPAPPKPKYKELLKQDWSFHVFNHPKLTGFLGYWYIERAVDWGEDITYLGGGTASSYHGVDVFDTTLHQKELKGKTRQIMAFQD